MVFAMRRGAFRPLCFVSLRIAFSAKFFSIVCTFFAVRLCFALCGIRVRSGCFFGLCAALRGAQYRFPACFIRRIAVAAPICPHTRFAGQKNNLYNGKG